MHRKPRNSTHEADVKKQIHGEGNYQATRDYNAGLKEHLATHDVDKEAHDAAPASSVEREEMESAERAGRARSRGEDSKKKPLPE
jgi:hypothetical protein